MLDRVLSCSTSTAVAGRGGAKGGCGWALLVECLLLVVEASVIRWRTSSSGRRIRDAALTMMGIARSEVHLSFVERSVCIVFASGRRQQPLRSVVCSDGAFENDDVDIVEGQV